MKINVIRVVLAGACTVLISIAGFTRTNHGWLLSETDQWFDSYGDLSWEDEKVHLDNFAIALQHDPESIGYIIVYLVIFPAGVLVMARIVRRGPDASVPDAPIASGRPDRPTRGLPIGGPEGDAP